MEVYSAGVSQRAGRRRRSDGVATAHDVLFAQRPHQETTDLRHRLASLEERCNVAGSDSLNRRRAAWPIKLDDANGDDGWEQLQSAHAHILLLRRGLRTFARKCRRGVKAMRSYDDDRASPSAPLVGRGTHDVKRSCLLSRVTPERICTAVVSYAEHSKQV